MSEKIKLDIDTGLSSLNNFNTLDGRSKCITIQNYYIYDDCYNANLQSFKKAIEFCSSQTKLGHCYGFFGEMAELGEDSFDYHQELIKYALQLGFKKIYFSIKSVRLLARLKALSIDEVTLFGNENNVLTEQVNSFVETNSHKSAVVLVKGSRSAKMERVIKQFETSLKINF